MSHQSILAQLEILINSKTLSTWYKIGTICVWFPSDAAMNKNKRAWLSDTTQTYFIRGDNAVQNINPSQICQHKCRDTVDVKMCVFGWDCWVSSPPRWVEPRGQSSAWWTWWSPETRARTQLGWNGHWRTSWGTTFLQLWIVLGLKFKSFIYNRHSKHLICHETWQLSISKNSSQHKKQVLKLWKTSGKTSWWVKLWKDTVWLPPLSRNCQNPDRCPLQQKPQ